MEDTKTTRKIQSYSIFGTIISPNRILFVWDSVGISEELQIGSKHSVYLSRVECFGLRV